MIAIIIPYYKINFFESVLQSLKNQTHKGFKVYIGNDASLQDPLPIIKSYTEDIDITYQSFDENLGGISLVKQWRRCLKLVGDEEWYMILGDDDYLEPNVIEMFYSHLETFKDKTDLVRYATKTRYVDKNELTRKFTHPIWEAPEDSFYRKFKGKTRSSLSEFVFSKETYEKHNFTEFPLAWHSDDKAWLDFANKQPIYTINDAAVIISVSSLSISGNTENKELKFKAQEAFYRSILENKAYQFSKAIYIDVVKAYEHIAVRNKTMHLATWLYINSKYWQRFYLKALLLFCKRSLGRLIRK